MGGERRRDGRIVEARWLPYSLPLARPWRSAAGTLTRRDGRLLRLTDGKGRNGWGECAPFPEIGIAEEAAARHAEDCARLDLQAQREGLQLWHLLSFPREWECNPGATPPGLRFRGVANGLVPVNAALGPLADISDADLAAVCAAGFQVLKLKVGLAEPAAELARLRTLAAQLPAGVRLRLDANGAWDEATAARFLAACAGLPVESCEEPVADPGALRRLQSACPFPLALDESLAHLAMDELLADPPVRRLVLKPARHGGLAPAFALAQRAGAAGLECVVTSALESACGVLAAAHLAAALANGLAHGLATSAWLAQDLGPVPAVRGGLLRLPARPGLGFSPSS